MPRAILQKKKRGVAVKSYDAAFKTLSDLIYSIGKDARIMTVLNDRVGNTEASKDDYSEIMDYLMIISNNHKYFRSVNLFIDRNDLLISPTSCLLQTQQVSEIYTQYRQDSPYSFFIFPEHENDMNEVMFLHRHFNSDGKLLGFILLRIDIKEFYEALGLPVTGNSDDIMLYINEKNEIITASHSALVGQELGQIIKINSETKTADYNGSQYIISEYNAYLGGRYIYLCSSDLNRSFQQQLIKIILILLIYVLIASVFSAFIIIARSSRPILDVLSYIQDLTDVPIKNTNEVSFITQSISDLEKARIVLSEEAKKNLLLLNKYQLLAYQNQMNPHFLCNTLETIKWMAFDLETDDFSLSDSIESLSKIAKYSLNGSDTIVSLQTELDYTETYIQILKIRYPDSLRFQWDVESGIGNVKVVKFCLQPFIENAVLHGMTLDKLPLTICVCVRTSGNDLIITIQDDGAGIEANKLERIQKRLKETEFQNDLHNIGIFNTNARIKLIYGNTYGVFVDSELHQGTTITLKMNLAK